MHLHAHKYSAHKINYLAGSEEHLKIIFRVPESTYMLSDLKEKKDASNILAFIFLIAQNVTMARSVAGGS